MINNRNHLRSVAIRAAILGVFAAMAACSSTPVVEKAADAGAMPTGSTSTDARAAGGNANSGSVAGRNAQSRMAVPGERSIFFEYDQFSIAAESRDVVMTNGNYLSKTTPAKVVIEGNADERGSSEYNLALGQKRAEAVRRALAVSGVPEAKMEAISYGKEKPRNQAHDEAAWSENRRVDLRY
jgi:peptidoglycan-associated lipoprotein